MKIEAELTMIRDLHFLKILKNDGRDVVIDPKTKDLLRIEDSILQAILKDITSPRGNLQKLKKKQAMIEALILNITSGAQDTDVMSDHA